MTRDRHLAVIRENHPQYSEADALALAARESALDAQLAIQSMIDTQQDFDAVEYGLRSVRTSHPSVDDVFRYQVEQGMAVARRLLGEDEGTALGLRIGQASEWHLKKAKKVARERLTAAKDAQRELGTIRQQRLALAA